MHLLALFSFALVACTANAQVPGVCNPFDVLKSHETFCSLYYQCLPDLSAVVRSCPEGTLFDDNIKICNYPQMVTCLNKQCINSFANNGPWADICCDRFIACNGNELAIGKCGAGTVFRIQEGKCVSDYACEHNAQCPRLNPVSTAEPVCNRRAVANDPCMFQLLDEQGNVVETKDCGEGTSFNDTLCNCGNSNPTCRKATAISINNRVFDPQCRATMVLDFTSIPPVTYTLKTTTGQRLMNNYSVGVFGYVPSNNEGVFATNAAGYPAHLYFWSFQRNMLVGPFGIKISFRVNNPQEGYSFTLIGNDMTDRRANCTGTLDIRATYRNRQWVIDYNVVAVNTVNNRRRTVQETQSVPATNGYTTVVFTMSRTARTMSGFIRSQGSNSVAWGPVDIGGDQIDINNCPLTVADGLEGTLNEVQFFEACGNLNLIQ